MGTLVAFHAHPDDEAISTSGTMAKAVAQGHRAVLVVATRGEQGETAAGMLDPGETLAERRTQETYDAAARIGIERVEFLGYEDSGMAGEATNSRPGCFWQADLDEAATRLAKILVDEDADVLTIYDEHGGYGHPDHIQVHRVGVRAAELAGISRVFEAVQNRDHLRRLIESARQMGMDLPELPEVATFDDFGVPEERITTAVDVSDYIDLKRAVMAAHASQIDEASLFLSLPRDAFLATWGTEWFIHRGVRPATIGTSLFEG